PCRWLGAAGSPVGGGDRGGSRDTVGQGNHVCIFPGLGLGALAARARRVTDGMTNAASKALAHQVTDDECDAGMLFPSVSRLRAVSYAIAIAVARQALEEGVGDIRADDIEAQVRAAMWNPEYPDYEPA